MREMMDRIWIIEKHFAALLKDIDEMGDYSVLIPIDDRWANPLPEIKETRKTQTGIRVMTISLVDWSRENSYFNADEGELNIVTAFGENNEENSATFKSTEVLALFDMDGNVLYSKTYYLPDIKKRYKKDETPSGEHTVRSLIGEKETSETSMKAMMKNNPHLMKGKKNEK